MKIGIGNDHAAVDMKNQVVEYLEGKGYEVVNFGTDTYESCNYPEYGEKVGRAVAAGDVDLGILICGTGVGISLAAPVWEGGNVNGRRKKRRDPRNERTASGAGQYPDIAGTFGTTGHGAGKRGCTPYGRLYRLYGNTVGNCIKRIGGSEEPTECDAGK